MSDPVNFAGPGLPTYSGRSICGGTERSGCTVPGVKGAREARKEDILKSIRIFAHDRPAKPSGKMQMWNRSRPKYWYNLKTGLVEEGRKSLWSQRMGPYDTPEE